MFKGMPVLSENVEAKLSFRGACLMGLDPWQVEVAVLCSGVPLKLEDEENQLNGRGVAAAAFCSVLFAVGWNQS